MQKKVRLKTKYLVQQLMNEQYPLFVVDLLITLQDEYLFCLQVQFV